MIPGLPKWSDTDKTTIDYLGPVVKPPLKKEWGKFVCYTLGPMKYGDPTGGVAQKWWAVHAVTLQDVIAIYLTPATADGSGWGVSRLFKTEHGDPAIKSISACFDGNGNVVISYCIDRTGSYLTTVNHRTSNGLDYFTLYGVVRHVVANPYPLGTAAEYPVHVFYIDDGVLVPDNKDKLFHTTVAGTDRIKHRLLGPTWELLHGGYRPDKLFQLAYKHDPDDVPPEWPDVTYTMGTWKWKSSWDDTVFTDNDALLISNVGVADNGELQVAFIAADDPFNLIVNHDNKTWVVDQEGDQWVEWEPGKWYNKWITHALGFGMYANQDTSTKSIEDYYDMYITITRVGSLSKRYKLARVPNEEELVWCPETSPGIFDENFEYNVFSGGQVTTASNSAVTIERSFSLYEDNFSDVFDAVDFNGDELVYKLEALPKKDGPKPIIIEHVVQYKNRYDDYTYYEAKAPIYPVQSSVVAYPYLPFTIDSARLLTPPKVNLTDTFQTTPMALQSIVLSESYVPSSTAYNIAATPYTLTSMTIDRPLPPANANDLIWSDISTAYSIVYSDLKVENLSKDTAMLKPATVNYFRLTL